MPSENTRDGADSLEEGFEHFGVLLGADVLADLLLVESRVLAQQRGHLVRVERRAQQAVLLQVRHALRRLRVELLGAELVQLPINILGA